MFRENRFEFIVLASRGTGEQLQRPGLRPEFWASDTSELVLCSEY